MIDREAFAALAARYQGSESAKYLDIEMWLEKNRARAKRLGIGGRPSRRVLDLGSGCGYFLHVCREIGHDARGIDWFEAGGIFDAVTSFLGVPVQQHRIVAGVPIPGAADAEVVTAHMICFNGHGGDVWGRDEWAWFLDQFTPGAVVGLEMNRERDGIMYQRGVAELFGQRGGVIENQHVVFSRLRSASPRNRA